MTPYLTEPKRSLGQNFFQDTLLAQKIVDLVLSETPQTILEIGPGRGAFTRLFLERGLTVIAVEKDQMLASRLEDQFKDFPFGIVNQDVLKTDINGLIPANGHTTVFGALPYNISKRIIRTLLKTEVLQNQYYIIQKEVAEKYIAKPPNSNLLSLTLQIYADCEKLLDINPAVFFPRPKVHSSLIKISLNPRLQEEEEIVQVTQLLKNAFRHPRKTLQNNLKEKYDTSKDSKIEKYLSKRPQELSLDNYFDLASTLY